MVRARGRRLKCKTKERERVADLVVRWAGIAEQRGSEVAGGGRIAGQDGTGAEGGRIGSRQSDARDHTGSVRGGGGCAGVAAGGGPSVCLAEWVMCAATGQTHDEAGRREAAAKALSGRLQALRSLVEHGETRRNQAKPDLTGLRHACSTVRSACSCVLTWQYVCVCVCVPIASCGLLGFARTRESESE